jgi:hypothetical protein
VRLLNSTNFRTSLRKIGRANHRVLLVEKVILDKVEEMSRYPFGQQRGVFFQIFFFYRTLWNVIGALLAKATRNKVFP